MRVLLLGVVIVELNAVPRIWRNGVQRSCACRRPPFVILFLDEDITASTGVGTGKGGLRQEHVVLSLFSEIYSQKYLHYRQP